MDIDWNQLFLGWYSWLSSLNSAIAEPVQALSDGVGGPLVSAVLLVTGLHDTLIYWFL